MGIFKRKTKKFDTEELLKQSEEKVADESYALGYIDAVRSRVPEALRNAIIDLRNAGVNVSDDDAKRVITKNLDWSIERANDILDNLS